mgnify:CR=1 FL=1
MVRGLIAWEIREKDARGIDEIGVRSETAEVARNEQIKATVCYKYFRKLAVLVGPLFVCT